MLEQGLIEESEERPDPELDDERRRYYRLTDFGRKLVVAESQRLRQLLNIAQGKRLLGGGKLASRVPVVPILLALDASAR